MESLGISVQRTIMGIYDENFKKKIVVACEDFTDSDNELVEFTKLANSVTKISKILKEEKITWKQQLSV